MPTTVKVEKTTGRMAPLVVFDREKRFIEGVALADCPRILAELGEEPFGYFEAERGLGRWEIGQRTERPE